MTPKHRTLELNDSSQVTPKHKLYIRENKMPPRLFVNEDYSTSQLLQLIDFTIIINSIMLIVVLVLRFLL